VENHLYVVAPRERDRDEYAPAAKQRDPLEALTASFEYSQAQTSALDVVARSGIGQMTTAELAAERTRLETQLSDLRDPRHDELARVTAQRAEAERAAVEARQRANEAESRVSRWRSRGRGESTTTDRATEAQAISRAEEVAARQGELEATIASARPDVGRAEQAARYAAVREELDRRSRANVRAAVVEKRDYLVSELGPYPHRRSQRRAWHRAAMRIETYRRDFGVRDQRNALGTETRDVAARAAQREVRREIERARQQVDRTSKRRARSREVGRG
jgi:hypothetical protein